MFTSGSFKLFEVGGTAVRVHPTFFLLLAWIGAIHWIQGGPQQALTGIVFVIVLFACVVLHEFGHILMARRFGIRTPDVTLLPIGGVAAMERIPEKPSEEILVAVAGPAVNLVIAGVLIALLGDSLNLERFARIEEAKPSFLAQVAVANLVLFVFNLIPAFPMDGGRVLRAVLATRFGHTQATRIAATFGQGIAILFGALGLMGNPFLILIALFIFLAASGEAGYVEMRDLTRDYRARDAMVSQFEALSPTADAAAAAAMLLRTTQQEFPVVDGAGTLRGLLTRETLIAALNNTGETTPVLEIMSADIPSVSEDAPLRYVIELLQRQRAPAVAVVNAQAQFVGYVNSQNLAEFVWVRSAQSRQPA